MTRDGHDTAEAARNDETESRLGRLAVFNLVVGLLHLGQGVLFLVLSNDLAFPITAAFLAGDPVASSTSGTPPATELVFELPVGPLVATFLFLAAIDHLLMATPGIRGWYERNLLRGRNTARWTEYAISASLMLILIAALSGIWSFGALVGLFAANSAMILFGWLQETDHEPGGSMTPFWFGTLIGLVPWAVIAYYLLAGENDPPGFVYGIFVSLFVFFMSFGLNQFLQYREVGRWRDYLHGEWWYVALSLGAKSALAWQVFANVLRA